jgi:endonuclease YncB( thermonuclease family)
MESVPPDKPLGRLLAWVEERNASRNLALSNEVPVAYTFFIPHGGGLGGVYLGGKNIAIPLLESGAAIVDEATLKCLPVVKQIQLLAAEAAREEKRGLWGDSAMLEAERETLVAAN